MKKILFLILIFFSFLTPCFAETIEPISPIDVENMLATVGSYENPTYPYSITYVAPTVNGQVYNKTVFLMSDNPIFVIDGKLNFLGKTATYFIENGLIVKQLRGPYTVYKPVEIGGSYTNILKASYDVYNFDSDMFVYEVGQDEIGILTSIYVFLAFAITVTAGGLVIYFLCKPIFYFLR